MLWLSFRNFCNWDLKLMSFVIRNRLNRARVELLDRDRLEFLDKRLSRENRDLSCS